MAEELSDSEFNEAEVFVDYNPHPYQGGYDVALTYGKPLPATPAICYPLSSAPASILARVPAALPEPTSQEPPPSSNEPEQLLLALPSLPQPPPSLPDVVTDGPGLPGLPTAANPWPYADPDGHWYVGARGLSPGCGNSCCGVGRKCKDSLWQRNAADYLFGYLPTWGPKRAETHTYANLNYAYERHRRGQAVSVVVEPEAKHTVFLNSSWFSSDEFLPEEETLSRELLKWRHPYESHSSEKPISVDIQSYQLYREASFSSDYEESNPENISQFGLEWYCNKGNADVKDEQYLSGFQYAYNSYTYQNPVPVELKPYQNSETLCYSEGNPEEPYPQSFALEWYNNENPVDSEIKISLSGEYIHQNSSQEEAYQYSDGCYAYKPLGCERSVSVEVQPVFSQSVYHGVYQEGKYPSSDGSYVDERHVNAKSSCFYVDPAENLWSQLVNGHGYVSHQQQLLHRDMCEPNHEQQVWKIPDAFEPAWFWDSS